MFIMTEFIIREMPLCKYKKKHYYRKLKQMRFENIVISSRFHFGFVFKEASTDDHIFETRSLKLYLIQCVFKFK